MHNMKCSNENCTNTHFETKIIAYIKYGIGVPESEGNGDYVYSSYEDGTVVIPQQMRQDPFDNPKNYTWVCQSCGNEGIVG